MRLIALIIAATLAFVIAGCGGGGESSPWGQIKLLGQEKTGLKLQVEQLENENKDLRRQVTTLTALDSDARLESLPQIKKIEIGRRSGFYDKDADGRKELFVVYVRPYDMQLDTVKAAGSVRIQLWDLGLDPAEALLVQWQVGPDELKEMWSATMMTNYYRLTYDVGAMPGLEEKELTVKVSFTDYITGKEFRAQHVIEP